ncbi:hypothetical protein F2Q68_00002236 [Brassica cretica]|uniref:Secreted protein n=2 Tax=Brassica cretica TaxID=69181 RepID=A0ABQ7CIK0_BRACR|nr:hypothetical protein F2Q68_00002236 [Brassica cretica]KAF3551779.1 hypothetical protein DY000_02002964 [Brassica cretica]
MWLSSQPIFLLMLAVVSEVEQNKCGISGYLGTTRLAQKSSYCRLSSLALGSLSPLPVVVGGAVSLRPVLCKAAWVRRQSVGVALWASRHLPSVVLCIIKGGDPIWQ